MTTDCFLQGILHQKTVAITMHQTAVIGVMVWGPCLALAIEKNRLVTQWVLLILLIVPPGIFIHLTSALWPETTLIHHFEGVSHEEMFY